MQQVLPVLQRLGVGATLRPSSFEHGTAMVLGNRNTTDDAVPSLVLAAEHYNTVARMARSGVPVEVALEVRTMFDEGGSANVIAEIPGTDPALRDEVVLIGAHLDSWHTANGAIDNGDGAIGVMEAMRILQAVGARPRRTIRVALWGGEEQGLLGARSYVERYLSDQAGKDRLAVFLNDDPGTGATYGFFMQGNEPAKTIFDAWLAPLADLGVRRNILEGIGSTDHVPFDQAGLPGFTAVKDYTGYDSRGRHTNQDFMERVATDDLAQSAIVMAVFAWHAAQRDERIPRPVPATQGGR
jgi:Zn-dependent M28 family amino/carboxypeptidase